MYKVAGESTENNVDRSLLQAVSQYEFLTNYSGHWATCWLLGILSLLTRKGRFRYTTEMMEPPGSNFL